MPGPDFLILGESTDTYHACQMSYLFRNTALALPLGRSVSTPLYPTQL